MADVEQDALPPVDVLHQDAVSKLIDLTVAGHQAESWLLLSFGRDEIEGWITEAHGADASSERGTARQVRVRMDLAAHQAAFDCLLPARVLLHERTSAGMEALAHAAVDRAARLAARKALDRAARLAAREARDRAAHAPLPSGGGEGAEPNAPEPADLVDGRSVTTPRAARRDDGLTPLPLSTEAEVTRHQEIVARAQEKLREQQQKRPRRAWHR